MLPEWLFNGRWAGSRRECAAPDGPRLLADATAAFVDGAPIDWAALLSRVRTTPDRVLLESLRAIDVVRTAILTDRETAAGSLYRLSLVRIVIALATIQTLWSLLLVAAALLQGADVGRSTPQIGLAAAFVGTCALFCRMASSDPRHTWLLATYMCAAAAFARGALSGIPEEWQAASALPVRALALEAFAPACLWQFALDFPRVRRFVWFDVLARRITAVAWTAGLVPFLLNLAVGWHVVPEVLFPGLLPHRAATIFWGTFTIVAVPGIGAVFVRSRHAPHDERKRVARFAAALAAGVSPFLLLGLVRTVIPDADAWLRTASSPERVWLDAMVVGALAAAPLLTAWAVIVDRPFESRRPSRRAHLLLQIELPVVVAASFAAAIVVAYWLPDSSVDHIRSRLAAWLLIGCTAAGVSLLLVRARDIVDIRPRFRRGTSLQDRLPVALDRLRTARGSREIAAVLSCEFQRAFGAVSVHVLTADRTGAFVDAMGSPVHLRRDAGLLLLLRNVVEPLDLSVGGPLLHLLSKPDREWVERNGLFAASAVRRRDDALAAIVLLGGKPAGLIDRRARWFVAALTSAAAAAWNDGAFDEPRPARYRHFESERSTDEEAAFECRRCGRVAASKPPTCCGGDTTLAALPRRLAGKFIVQRRIGAGGMGVVYLARDLALGRPVALKTLPEIGSGRIPRLRAEARAMASLSHECLATIYGLELWKRTPVLVLEYFPEGTLAVRLASGPLPPGRVLRIGIGLARALAFMHARGVLHRDLKPGNIALTATDVPRILDFGLLGLIEASAGPRRIRHFDGLTSGGRGGTLPYLPPEAFESSRTSHHFDLWALSVVMLEALTGVNPFAGPNRHMQVARAREAERSELIARVRMSVPTLADFLERATAREQGDRFQSATEILAVLESMHVP